MFLVATHGSPRASCAMRWTNNELTCDLSSLHLLFLLQPPVPFGLLTSSEVHHHHLFSTSSTQPSLTLPRPAKTDTPSPLATALQLATYYIPSLTHAAAAPSPPYPLVYPPSSR